MGGGNGQKAATRRERLMKEKAKEGKAASQLKVNEAVYTFILPCSYYDRLAAWFVQCAGTPSCVR